ncbi:MAG: hypothetical protein NTX64_05890 [Elusimicrobia bacterium]|nr:hypothetical protein [Elusimicrobiota bacterium]
MVARAVKRSALAAALAAALAVGSRAADYEIQIYPGQTAERGSTFLELHSNTVSRGPREGEYPERQPSAHSYHQTLEITRGFTDWFETGFYVFTSARSGEGWDWVGDHIRPRVAVPVSWGWPVGLSLSAEVGYLKPRFAESRWDLELRPILDYRRGAFYVSLNPALERNLRLYGSGSRSFAFAPQLKLSYDAFRYAALGIEYYANLGPVENFSGPGAQQHQLMPVVDLLGIPAWELNAGVGFGLTRATDALTVKAILGRRF